MKDHEGYDHCDRCKILLGYAYPSHFCDPCIKVREAEDVALGLAASIILSRDIWDTGGAGQTRLELIISDRFLQRERTYTTHRTTKEEVN